MKRNLTNWLILLVILCSSASLKAQTLLLQESFESTPADWSVDASCQSYVWGLSTTIASDGVQSAAYQSEYAPTGCNSDLYSPLFTLNNASSSDSIRVYFDFYRSSVGSTYDDRMELQMVDKSLNPLGTSATIYRYYGKQPVSPTVGFVRYIWRVPVSDLGSGNKIEFYARFRGVSGNGYNMFLDNIEFFHIKRGPTKILQVTAPNGGEVLSSNSTYNIKWKSTGVTAVNIDFSVNGGVSWNSIATRVSASNQNYNWVVPAAFSKTCKVRIIDADDTRLNDVSDADFEILEGKLLTLTSPNGGENVIAGSTYNILWDAQNVSKANLEFSINGGVNWAGIVTNTDATTKSYAWVVPNTPSLTCKVRITDANDAARFDESDAYFVISQASAINENEQENSVFKIYPNPASGIISFELKGQNLINSRIYIRNLAGQVVFEENINGSEQKLVIDLGKAKIAEGVYFIEYKNSKETVTQKLIVTK